jgi:hypothetical protein
VRFCFAALPLAARQLLSFDDTKVTTTVKLSK